MSSLHQRSRSFQLLQACTPKASKNGTQLSLADSVNIQKKKKLKQELEREIEKDMQNIRAARALAPQAVGRPSIHLHVNDVIQQAPKFQSSNGHRSLSVLQQDILQRYMR